MNHPGSCRKVPVSVAADTPQQLQGSRFMNPQADPPTWGVGHDAALPAKPNLLCNPRQEL